MSMLKITELKVEGMVCPMGIDTARHTFSYILKSEDKNKYQSAYRIKIATSPEGLDTPDMWDSGKVSSDKTSWIECEGKELSSRCEYFFCVTVWNEEVMKACKARSLTLKPLSSTLRNYAPSG